jgi:opacity protein-like surface antigen
MVPIRRFIAAFFAFLFAAGVLCSHAQVVPSANRGKFSLTAGGLGSVFQPDYAGLGEPETSPQRLYGAGAFVDLKFTHWIQIEAEGRWLRFNTFNGIDEDTYLAGPRLPIHRFRFFGATPYVKALAGYGRMTFENKHGWGRYTAVAYGGGVDFRVTKRISARLPDFEYQQWPNWSEGTKKSYTLWPYGLSVGVSYRILGRP